MVLAISSSFAHLNQYISAVPDDVPSPIGSSVAPESSPTPHASNPVVASTPSTTSILPSSVPTTTGHNPVNKLDLPNVSVERTAFNKRMAAVKQLNKDLAELEKNLKANPSKPFPVSQYAAKLSSVDKLIDENNASMKKLDDAYRVSGMVVENVTNDERDAAILYIDMHQASLASNTRLDVNYPTTYLDFVRNNRNLEGALLQPLEQLRNKMVAGKFDETKQRHAFTAMEAIYRQVPWQRNAIPMPTEGFQLTAKRVNEYIDLVTSDAYQTLDLDSSDIPDTVAGRLATRPDDAPAIQNIIDSDAFKNLGRLPVTSDNNDEGISAYAQQRAMIKFAQGGLPFDSSGKTAEQKTQQVIDACKDNDNLDLAFDELNTYNYASQFNGTDNAAAQKLAVDNLRQIVARSLYQNGSKGDRYWIVSNAMQLFKSAEFATHSQEGSESPWLQKAVDSLIGNRFLGKKYGLNVGGWRDAINYANKH